MAYRNAIYNSRNQSITLFTWNEDGERVEYDVPFRPYLYVEDVTGKHTSIYGTKLKQKIFNSSYDRNKFVNESGVKRLFENIAPTQQFLLDTYWNQNETLDFVKNDIKVMFLDIETYSVDTFPDPEDPTHTINVITCFDTLTKTYTSFGLGSYKGTEVDVIHHNCKTERELLTKFVNFIKDDYPDILSGWNSEFFDIPYILNRVERILGEEVMKTLSPARNVYYRNVKNKFGQDKKRYYIDGVACIDYLDIYKRFCLKLRESYKLNAIAEIELREKKIDYGDIDLATLADTDWEKFMLYNIQDVRLLVKLEEKLQYIYLLRMLSYVGLTTFEGAMGTIGVINGALTIKARKRGEVLSTFVRNQDTGKNPGAYVSDPKGNFQENIVSFDANSLYPNVMISLNLSPETKVGRVERDVKDGTVNIYHVSGKSYNMTPKKFATFMEQEELALTKAGFLFTQKKKGIIPEFLDYYYNERVKVKTELSKAKRELSTLDKADSKYRELQFEVERLNTKQMVIKILVNSCYGYMGNKQAPIGDDDIASSVTLTGQAVIKQAGKFLQDYLKNEHYITDEKTLEDSWIYSDTDSLYFSLACIKSTVPIKDGTVVSDVFYKEVEKIEDYLNTNITSWAIKNLRTKDSRFVFKRECISDVGIFLQKKRYVMHILDDEGLKVDKFKYTGVEVVRTTMPDAIKPYAKKIIETMLYTKSLSQTNKLLNETYEIFKSLRPEEIAFVMGVKNYDKVSRVCNDLNTPKGTPIHVKSAHFHNVILDKLNCKFDRITSGDKVRYLYIEKPNKYNISSIGFKYEYPSEFKDLFKIDYDKMFERILFNMIERFYIAVDWRVRKPADNVQTELFDLFGDD